MRARVRARAHGMHACMRARARTASMRRPPASREQALIWS